MTTEGRNWKKPNHRACKWNKFSSGHRAKIDVVSQTWNGKNLKPWNAIIPFLTNFELSAFPAPASGTVLLGPSRSVPAYHKKTTDYCWGRSDAVQDAEAWRNNHLLSTSTCIVQLITAYHSPVVLQHHSVNHMAILNQVLTYNLFTWYLWYTYLHALIISVCVCIRACV